MITWVRSTTPNSDSSIWIRRHIFDYRLTRLRIRDDTDISWIKIRIKRNIRKLNFPITARPSLSRPRFTTWQCDFDIITSISTATADDSSTTFSRFHFTGLRSSRFVRCRNLIDNKIRSGRNRRHSTRRCHCPATTVSDYASANRPIRKRNDDCLPRSAAATTDRNRPIRIYHDAIDHWRADHELHDAAQVINSERQEIPTQNIHRLISLHESRRSRHLHQPAT